VNPLKTVMNTDEGLMEWQIDDIFGNIEEIKEASDKMSRALQLCQLADPQYFGQVFLNRVRPLIYATSPHHTHSLLTIAPLRRWKTCRSMKRCAYISKSPPMPYRTRSTLTRPSEASARYGRNCHLNARANRTQSGSPPSGVGCPKAQGLQEAVD
jgi:hypothetical protein